jgi:hypothetical protein
VNVEGSYLNPKKITIVENFLTPKTITNDRAFLGLIGYYRKFILGYTKIAEPLFCLTKKECKFVWTPICQKTFIILKKCLITSLVLIN